jgi:hypothetical protein
MRNVAGNAPICAGAGPCCLSRLRITLRAGPRHYRAALDQYVEFNTVLVDRSPQQIRLAAAQRHELVSRPGGFHPVHRVTGGSHPPPVPTELSVRISRTTLFSS